MGLPAFMATFIKRGKMKRNVKDRKHAYAKKLIPVFKAEAVKLAKQSGARSQEPASMPQRKTTACRDSGVVRPKR